MNFDKIEGVVFFDLDGTLLDDRSRITDEVAAATEQLKANNILPVICTGRSPHEILHAQEMTKIETVITLNGSLVKNNEDILYQSIIPTDTCEAVIAQANNLGDGISMYNNQAIRTNDDTNEEMIHSHKEIVEPLPKVEPDFYKSNDVNMMVVYTLADGSQYNKQFGDTLKFYKTGPYSLDCVRKEVSKQTGIIELLKALNLTKLPTYAFGDGPNDVEMLDYVDHAVVMGNARKDIFKYAEFITTKNTDSGIFNGLKHYNLI